MCLPDGTVRRRVRSLASCFIWIVVDLFESLQDCDAIGEAPVCQQECVQKVNAEKAKVSQTLEQSVKACISDLKVDQVNMFKTKVFIHIFNIIIVTYVRNFTRI